MTELSDEFGSTYVDPDVERFLEEGKIADIDGNVILTEDRTIAYWLRLEGEDGRDFHDYKSDMDILLESNGYESGEKKGNRIYVLEAERDALELALSESYVQSVSFARG